MFTRALASSRKGAVTVRLLKHVAPYRSMTAVSARDNYLKIHPTVKDAIARKKPVVALESTIITHGMPYPENFRMAVDVEELVRDKCVEPATIAVIDGIIHIGLSEEDLHKLAESSSAVKISRRGLSASVAKKQTGGTTVSATMLLAHWCNIPIFVTGGIGGVHRHGEVTLDVSSDLTELGRTPVTVVSAGIKSILDIPRTLEYLETQGVTVATYGQTTDFPAFFTPSSGSKSQLSLESAKEAAELIQVSSDMAMNSGCLIGVPIPREHAAHGEEIEKAIREAVAEAESGSIHGAEVTPYILKRVNELTDGDSLKANVALIKNNASVGAEIAVELAKLRSNTNLRTATKTSRPVVIGGTNVDIVSQFRGDAQHHGPSNLATISLNLGGVGRNVAEGLCRFSDDPVFITAVGDDAHGDIAQKQMEQYMDLSFVEKVADERSAVYNVMMNSDGEVELAAEDMKIHDKMTADVIMRNEDVIMKAPVVCMDGNIPTKTMAYICDLCRRKDLNLFFEPTGSLKAGRPFENGVNWKSIKYTTPNLQEFEVMVSTLKGDRKKINLQENAYFTESALTLMHDACRKLLEHIYCVAVTLGNNGAVTFVQDHRVPTGVNGTYYPLSAMPRWEWLEQPVVNVSGSGDTFASAFIHGLVEKKPIEICTKMGLLAAQHSLRSRFTVSTELRKAMFENIENEKWDTHSV